MWKLIRVIFVLGFGGILGFGIFLMGVCGGFGADSGMIIGYIGFFAALPLALLDIYYTFRTIGKILNENTVITIYDPLRNYIKQARKSGMMDIEIEEALIKDGGWEKNIVRGVFKDLSR